MAASTCKRWSDLPSELLECIAERLNLIELPAFRGVCKNWNAATSAASTKVESEPWFLTYGGSGGDSKCNTAALFADSGRKYSTSLPELEGATCLASNQGWLLLYRQTSIFFFCPFSRALIHLPTPLPPSLVSRAHRAAAQFSSPPTSPDCTVCIIAHTGGYRWKVYRIRRGTNTWTERRLPGNPSKFEYAGYNDGNFCIADDRQWLFYAAEDVDGMVRLWNLRFTKRTKDDDGTGLRLSNKRYVDSMKERLGLNEEFKLIKSVCGTMFPLNHATTLLIPYQEIDGDDEESDSRSSRKGVWLLPRCHRIDPSQTW